MWLTEFKIALVEKNTDKLAKLMEDVPHLEKAEDIEQALFLLKQATELVESLKNETAISMKKVKTHISFLKSTQNPQKTKFDIKL